MKLRMAAVAALATAAFFGCGPSAPTGPGGAAPTEERRDSEPKDMEAPRPQRAGSLADFDDLMCRLEKRFNGFAGVEKDGQALVLSFSSDPPKDLGLVVSALRRAGITATGQPIVRRVRYGFCELQSPPTRARADLGLVAGS